MAESADEESDDPLSPFVGATIAFALAAFFLFGEAIGATATVPPEDALTTSEGIIIAIERRYGEDDMSLRLSDSTRWYVLPPYAERHEGRIERELRHAKPGAIVTVAHDKADLGPEPVERWYVVAFGIAINGREILTHADVVAGRERDKWVARGMAALLGLWGAAYVVLALMRLREPVAVRHRRPTG